MYLKQMTAGLLLMAFALPATAQQSPLDSVPGDAPIVIQLNGVEKAQERLVAMLESALPDMAPMAEAMLAGGLQEMLAGRDIDSVDQDRPVFLVFTDLDHIDSDPPAMAILVPVSDADAFKKGFFTAEERDTLQKGDDGIDSLTVENDKVYVGSVTGYAVVAPTRDDAETVVQAKGGLQLGEALGQSYLSCDVAAYVNLRTINEKYSQEIQGFKQLMEFALQQGGGIDEATAEMVKTMFEGLFQVIEDGRGLIVGAEFRPEGLNLRMQASFGADSETNNFLGKLSPSALEGLSNLPPGQMAYSGMQLDAALIKALGGLILNAGGDAEVIAEGLEKMANAGISAQYSTSRFPIAGIEVTISEDPKALVDAELEMVKSLPEDGTFQTAAIKGKPVIKENAESYRGFNLHYIEVQFDLEKMLEAQGGAAMPEEFKEAMRESLEQMFGGDTMKAWFGTDGKVSLQVTAQDWEGAQELLDAYLAGDAKVGDSEGFQLTRSQLPAEATVLGLMETGKTFAWLVDYVGTIMKAMGPALPIPGQLKVNPPRGEPSYIGFSLVLEDGTGQADLFIPTTAVQQIRSMVEPLLRPVD